MGADGGPAIIEEMPTRRRARRRIALMVIATAALVVVLLGVFPTTSYIRQREQIAQERQKHALLVRENHRLAARVRELHTDAEIERLAREQYNLVKPGEEAYAILPAPGAEAPPGLGSADDPLVPASASEGPPRHVEAAGATVDGGLWSRVWDAVTFWD